MRGLLGFVGLTAPLLESKMGGGSGDRGVESSLSAREVAPIRCGAAQAR
jgi:hypothetical protein